MSDTERSYRLEVVGVEANYTLALVGNVNPEIFWSTENEYFDAYTRAGHDVMGVQEGDPQALTGLLAWIRSSTPPEFVHWTRTKSQADKWGDAGQWELIAACRRANVPLIAIHLDRWWGLRHPDREAQILTDPYFKGVDIFFSADGGHQEEWQRAGINHKWLLPAISERWLGLGTPKPEYECDIVFVGGWYEYGHKAWKHRHEMINFLQHNYGDRFLALPHKGQPRIVGRDLNDVYASAKVVCGDSCLIPNADGSPATRYVSDRIPESAGRGAILLHPRVEGINASVGEPFHNCTIGWDLWDWDQLRATIDRHVNLGDDEDRMRSVAINEITKRHTYTHRVREVVGELELQGVL